jgi:hypothetical protein
MASLESCNSWRQRGVKMLRCCVVKVDVEETNHSDGGQHASEIRPSMHVIAHWLPKVSWGIIKSGGDKCVIKCARVLRRRDRLESPRC